MVILCVDIVYVVILHVVITFLVELVFFAAWSGSKWGNCWKKTFKPTIWDLWRGSKYTQYCMDLERMHR